MSVGANVIEAKNSSSRIEFKRYYETALKSGNETIYWLCILRDGFGIKDEDLGRLINECKELTNILAASIIKLKKAKPEA